MGQLYKRKFQYHDEYGPSVGGYKYKSFKPDPLAITILRLAAKSPFVFRSGKVLLKAILDYAESKEIRFKSYQHLNTRQLRSSLQYLKRKQFIAFPGKGRFTITKEGRARLDKINLDKIKISRSETWDGKWRLLTFDIPEEKTDLRDYFRKRLKEIGFYHFQRSVFILPYPCNTEIDEMNEILGISSSVHLITGDRFEGDEELLKHFSLK